MSTEHEDLSASEEQENDHGHRYGARCKGCGGEDCPCCEVYLEWKAEQTHDNLYGYEREPDEDDGASDAYWESVYEDARNVGYQYAERHEAREEIEQVTDEQCVAFTLALREALGESAVNSSRHMDGFLDGYRQYVCGEYK